MVKKDAILFYFIWVYCQLGRRPGLELGGCRFKSCYPDQIYAAVTQWIRVLRYERRSQEFESLRWRQF